MAQVLEFIEYLQFKHHKEEQSISNAPTAQTNHEQPPISHYAGMIKLPKTGTPKSLMDFDASSTAKNEKLS